MTVKKFGWGYALGAGVRVEVDGQRVLVKGAPGFEVAEAAIRDVETVSVQYGALGAGPAHRRMTYVQLVGHGTTLGQAAVNTVFGFGRSHAARQAADWLRSEIERLRP